MKTAIRKNLGNFTAVVVLFLIAMAVGGYILHMQRLRFPFVQDKPYQLKAAFSTAQAVTPGQGQTVRISGVRIGDIAKVKLEDGRAIVTMDIDKKYTGIVHKDATALLRPKTGLKDMFVELRPGSDRAPVATKDWILPIQNTLPDINPDEIFAALDSDTRDYLKLLIGGAGRGLDQRGGDLQEVFRRFEPTHRDLARVTSAVAERRENLRRLVNSLQRLNGELASRKADIAQLVDTSATVFRAFASEDRNISRTVRDLPGTLRQATTTLGKVETYASVLGPTADKLRPAVRSLNRANHAIRPFVREAAPILRERIRPFVREVRPLVRDLKPAANNLARATPDLQRTFRVLNHLFDVLAYNPNGREDPGVPGRQEGYLFWVAWLGHQGNTLFSTGDAHSSFRPVFLGGACATLKNIGTENPDLGAVLGPIIANPNVCPA